MFLGRIVRTQLPEIPKEINVELGAVNRQTKEEKMVKGSQYLGLHSCLAVGYLCYMSGARKLLGISVMVKLRRSHGRSYFVEDEYGNLFLRNRVDFKNSGQEDPVLLVSEGDDKNLAPRKSCLKKKHSNKYYYKHVTWEKEVNKTKCVKIGIDECVGK